MFQFTMAPIFPLPQAQAIPAPNAPAFGAPENWPYPLMGMMHPEIYSGLGEIPLNQTFINQFGISVNTFLPIPKAAARTQEECLSASGNSPPIEDTSTIWDFLEYAHVDISS